MPVNTADKPGVRRALVARNSLLNFAGQAAPMLAAFLALPFIIHGLGTVRFGVLAIVWTALSYFSDLGFGPVTSRFVAAAIGAGKTDEIGDIIWTAGTLQVLVGVLEGIALAAVTPWLTTSILKIPADVAPQARACLFLLAATIPVLGLARSFRGISEAAQRFDLALAVDIPVISAMYVLGALGAIAGWRLFAVFGVILGCRLIGVPAYLLAARKALPGVSFRRSAKRGNVGELTRFAGWAATSSVVSPLLVYLDRFVVGAVLSMTAVAFYTAPYELVTRLVLIPAGIVGALYPAFSHLVGQQSNDEVENLAATSVNVVLLLLAPFLVVVLGFARDGLSLWLGPQYANSSAIAAQILIVGVLINACAHVPFALLQSHGRPEVPAVFHLIELPVHLAVALFLVSRYGVAGAALAWSIRVAFDATLLFVAAARMRLLSLRSLAAARVGVTILLLLTAGAAAALFVPVLHSIVMRAGASILLALTTLLLLWFLTISISERSYIKQAVRVRLNVG